MHFQLGSRTGSSKCYFSIDSAAGRGDGAGSRNVTFQWTQPASQAVLFACSREEKREMLLFQLGSRTGSSKCYFSIAVQPLFCLEGMHYSLMRPRPALPALAQALTPSKSACAVSCFLYFRFCCAKCPRSFSFVHPPPFPWRSDTK